MREFLRSCLPLIDLVLVPIAAIASLPVRVVRRGGIGRLPLTSIMLRKFRFHDGSVGFPRDRQADCRFFYRNGACASEDAEFLHNTVRPFEPRRSFQLGSGRPTPLATSAATANGAEEAGYQCGYGCVEPYEAKWLNRLDGPAEPINTSSFRGLEKNDILSIDSSHIIRPQGEVLFEYFDILPTLEPGALIHIHDIFSPKDHPEEWTHSDARFSTEQYLPEAVLSYNQEFKIIGALNFLKHHHPEELTDTNPVLRNQLEFRERVVLADAGLESCQQARGR